MRMSPRRIEAADNCLIIVMDTVRAGSTYIEHNGITPQLEQVTSNGTSFERAITPAPWTLPSHASMYTGLYPNEHGATHQQKWLDTEHTTLPEKLQTADIRTGLFTANMFLTESFNMARGFDEVSFIRGEDNKVFEDSLDPIQFLNEREHDEGIDRFVEIGRAIGRGSIWKNIINATYYKLKDTYRRQITNPTPPSWDEQAVADAREFISTAVESDERFFSMVNFIGAHGPWEFNRDHLDAIGITPEDIAPINRWKEVAANSEAQWPYAAGEIEFDDTDREILTHLYESWVHRVDELFGEMITHLEDEGVNDDTLVIVTADHGECIAQNRVLGHELTIDETVTHVPLIVSGPGIPDETVTDPVSLKDMYGTVLSALGIDNEEQQFWDAEARGHAFTEMYPVDPETVSERYRTVATEFGRRYALFTSDGWAERREQTGETYGDEQMLADLDVFVSNLHPHIISDEANSRDLPSEVENRLQKLGYKS